MSCLECEVEIESSLVEERCNGKTRTVLLTLHCQGCGSLGKDQQGGLVIPLQLLEEIWSVLHVLPGDLNHSWSRACHRAQDKC